MTEQPERTASQLGGAKAVLDLKKCPVGAAKAVLDLLPHSRTPGRDLLSAT
jgi:hypothetical protein